MRREPGPAASIVGMAGALPASQCENDTLIVHTLSAGGRLPVYLDVCGFAVFSNSVRQQIRAIRLTPRCSSAWRLHTAAPIARCGEGPQSLLDIS